ncbi:hypothetical protein QTP88_007109 [Uroleucon formosanum]
MPSSGRRTRRDHTPTAQLRHLLRRILELYERVSAAYHRVRAGPVHPESHILERLRFTSWQSPKRSVGRFGLTYAAAEKRRHRDRRTRDNTDEGHKTITGIDTTDDDDSEGDETGDEVNGADDKDKKDNGDDDDYDSDDYWEIRV